METDSPEEPVTNGTFRSDGGFCWWSGGCLWFRMRVLAATVFAQHAESDESEAASGFLAEESRRFRDLLRMFLLDVELHLAFSDEQFGAELALDRSARNVRINQVASEILVVEERLVATKSRTAQNEILML